MNAADYYGLDELRRSCVGFVQCCINVDTVCALLASAERYIQYKCTKSLVQKVRFYFFSKPNLGMIAGVMLIQVLEFVDEHGNEVLNLGSFTLLPQHVVRLVLCRDELKADEFTKFQVPILDWNEECKWDWFHFRRVRNRLHWCGPKSIATAIQTSIWRRSCPTFSNLSGFTR